MAAIPRESYLYCHFLFRQRHNSPRFVKIEAISSRCLVHVVHLHTEADLDDELAGWVREAYEYEQAHPQGWRNG